MSAAETNKVKAKLAALVASFDGLEAELEPLFAQTLPETLVGLEPLQQAKLQTLLPYLVYDLIFIYLKAKGIDPRTHPVIGELDRIRQYFDKISHAENPPAKRTEVDKAAAGRFIKHAIAQSQMQWKKSAAEAMQDASNAKKSLTTTTTPTTTTPSSSSSSSSSKPPPPATHAPLPPGKTTAKMRERAAYEAKLRAGVDDGAAGLEVLDGDGGDEDGGDENEDVDMDMDVDMDAPQTTANGKGKKGKNGKGKGKAPANAEADPARSSATKRRRPVLDPFAGYGDDVDVDNDNNNDNDNDNDEDDASSAPTPVAAPSTTTSASASTKKTKPASATSTPAKKSKKKSSSSSSSGKKSAAT